MRVGVPKEIKIQSIVSAFTPGAVREYVAQGNSVVVETSAGAGIGANRETYRKAGAVIANTAAEISACGHDREVKEPQASECPGCERADYLTYLHLSPDLEQAKGLMVQAAPRIAYERIRCEGRAALLAPMSEVARKGFHRSGGLRLERAQAAEAFCSAVYRASYLPGLW